MYNRILLILPLALGAALLGGGCAHDPSSTQPRAEPGQVGPALPAAAADSAIADLPPTGVPTSPARSGLIKPEYDARYHLPAAQKRALNIYLGSQTFEYLEDGQVFLSGQISSGSPEHPTPTGEYSVLSKDINKRSGKYTNGLDENTPMPYSLQFSGPYFVHEGWVPGYAESHGCVRLHYENARLLFDRMRVGDRVAVKGQGEARPANPYPDLFPVF